MHVESYGTLAPAPAPAAAAARANVVYIVSVSQARVSASWAREADARLSRLSRPTHEERVCWCLAAAAAPPYYACWGSAATAAAASAPRVTGSTHPRHST